MWNYVHDDDDGGADNGDESDDDGDDDDDGDLYKCNCKPTTANIRAHAIRERKNKPPVHPTNESKQKQKTNQSKNNQTKANTKKLQRRKMIG